MSDTDLTIEEAPDEAGEETTVLLEDDEQVREEDIPEELNLLPLRDSVIYPMLIAPLSVGRESSIRLLDESVGGANRVVGVVAQREPSTDEPGFEDVFGYGCAVVVRTLMKAPDATRLIVQGSARFKIVEPLQTEPYMRAKVEVIQEPPVLPEDEEEVEALKRSIASLFDQAVRLAPHLPEELRALTSSVEEPNVMTDLVAAHMPLSVDQKESILETVGLRDRMRLLLEILGREVRVLELTTKVQSEVNAELSKSQRDYYLREQLKAIQKELGEGEGTPEDLDELRMKLEEAKMPAEAKKSATKELERLARINPSSPEYTVSRNYLETMIALPWDKKTTDKLDLDHAREVLDADHFGLEKIKDRIIEFLAVRKVKGEGPIRQPILCFVGPPGVGKTSLGKSIARSIERKFYRISLGGMRDEAEIRGHRRTYIGSMPGQIIQGLRRVEVNNPVFMLDEIDKLGSDFRGDPSSALLEVLDPEQNDTFRDHYIDAPFDLSNVFFITTANRLDTIPPPLRDRMEIIEVSGYTEDEKVEIAKRHLVPQQVKEHGIPKSKIAFKDDALVHLVRHYTREAGVRNLNREVGSVARKVAVEIAKGRKSKLSVTKNFVKKALGAPRYLHDEVAERELTPGMAIGMAWTPVGGDVLFIETAAMPGKRNMMLTGQLGDVMKESVTAAMTWLRSHHKKLKIDPEAFDKEVHVHVPAGAVPKDGPSAGVTMLTALAGLFTGRTPKPRTSMTGEITLTGQVLPVGGIKEKVLAAHRAGVETVILPEQNRKDYDEDVPDNVKAELTVHFVKEAPQVLRHALEK